MLHGFLLPDFVEFHAAALSPDKSSDNVEVVVSEETQHQQEDEVFEDTEAGPEPGNLSFEGVGGNSYQLSTTGSLICRTR